VAESEARRGSGQKSLRRVLYAELDGIAPQELILHTDEYVGEGAW
jgi:hypothetical protein